MARSRYSNTPIIGRHHYSTFPANVRSRGLGTVNLLSGVRTTEYTIKVGDRIDHIAAKHLGDDQYWWVIALVNGINYPFSSGGFTPGRLIKIPVDVKDVLDKLLR
jgi:hypothetical protein